MGVAQSRVSESEGITAANRSKERRKSVIAGTIGQLRYRGSKMGRKRETTSDGLNEHLEDTAMQPSGGSTGASGSSASASRRRTRSMTMAEREDGDVEMIDETAMRRIRRRMKGKSREGTQEDDLESEVVRGEQMNLSRSEAARASSQQDSAMSAPQISTSRRSSAITSAPISSIADLDLDPGGPRRVEAVVPPSSLPMHPLLAPANSARPAAGPPQNPMDLTGEERSRARLQIAQALGDRAGQHRQAESTSSVPTNYRPSMLSALLTDILGLRTNQIAATAAASSASNVAPGSPSQPAASLEARQRNGGTSVIVQGALISRTLPTQTSPITVEAATGIPNEEDSAMDVSDGADAAAASNVSTTPLATLGEEAGQGYSEAQVATVEEQAAMLIRLLSIATAATAASIMSRPSAQQSIANVAQVSSDIEGVSIPGEASGPSEVSNSSGQIGSNNDSSHLATSSQASANESGIVAASVPASGSTPSSTSQSTWRQASQTYQTWRARLLALRRRLRIRTLPLRVNADDSSSDRNGQVSIASLQQQDSTPRTTAEATPGLLQPVAVLNEPQRHTEHQEMSTGSLDTLSNMLQEAIRQGGRRASHPSQNSGNASENSNDRIEIEEGGNGTFNIQSTLNAVREGNLARGLEGTFDRFLFDLMADLDVAVRRMPREGETAATTLIDVTSDDEIASLRRGRDLRDGQLSFFRSFTFPVTSASDGADQQASAVAQGLLPCIVVGVRSLGVGQRPRGPTSASMGGFGAAQGGTATVPSTTSEGQASMPTSNSTPMSSQSSEPSAGNPTLSRFLLFVSGGHYPPQHPLFHSSSEEAARDLMVLIEFLGAMTSFQVKPSTVTKEEIEKCHLQMVNGGLDSINTLVKEKKIMENTSERCLICLEDWQEVDESRRLLNCSHLFHAPCIDQWLTASNNSCPLCRRQAVSKKSNIPLSNATNSVAS